MNAERNSNNGPTSAFEALPTDIIQLVLAHLSPLCLSSVSQTSAALRFHAQNDRLWSRLVQDRVPNLKRLPARYETWRELYCSFHPFWFITRGKIWFSDKSHVGDALMGSIIVARYNARQCCMETYRLVAERIARHFLHWERDQDVIIHDSHLRVELWLDHPIFMLRGRPQGYGGHLQETYSESQGMEDLRTTIFFCRPMPPQIQDPSVNLWPPATLPAIQRVRIDSQSLFTGLDDKPQTLGEASDCTFRLRTWLEMPPGTRHGESVMTFSTLPEEVYTPTREKPWQGIWVGDYSSHGCEFLVVIQTLSSKPLQAEPQSHEAGSISIEPNGEGPVSRPAEALPSDSVQADQEGEDGSYRGRLEAIKLTGDQNVPRGEYSWIAEDIGPQGLIRIAEEAPFRGARIVRSIGHLADDGFRNGEAALLFLLLRRYMRWNSLLRCE